jgi:hypothetical protein
MFVGSQRYRAREDEIAPTFRLTGWPIDADYTDIGGAQAFLHAAAARLLGHPAPDYVMHDLPEWSREHIEHFGPDPGTTPALASE